MRFSFPLFLFIVLSAKTFYSFGGSDNCISVNDGDFNDAANWSCGHVPDKDDNVTIDHNINLNISFTGGNAVKGVWTINSGKELFSSTNSLEIGSTGQLASNGNLELDNLTFNNGSNISIASSSNVIINGNLINSNNSNNVIVDGNLRVNGDFSNGTNSIISGSGEINVTGNFTNASTASVFGFTGSGFNCGNCTLSAAVLPVKFISFAASLNENKTVRLKWSTASEENNDFFTIERSINGLNFSDIGRKKGAGNSSSVKNYEFIDDSPVKGVSYYRIRQTDFDGKFDYSDMTAVSFQKNSDGSCVLKIFPNPCPGKCYVSLSDCKENEDSEIIIEIVDALGNKILQRIPYRNSDGSFTFYMDDSNLLAPGIYVVKAASGKENYNKKIIVK